MRRTAFAIILTSVLSACAMPGSDEMTQSSSSASSVSSVAVSSALGLSSSSRSAAVSSAKPTPALSSKPVVQPSSAAVSSAQATASLAASAAASVQASVSAPRVIRITVEDFAFTPSLLTVKKGEKVTLIIDGKSGAHGFAIPGLRINERVDAGQSVTIELPTDTAGSFDFLCSIPCGPGHREMKGRIVIQ